MLIVPTILVSTAENPDKVISVNYLNGLINAVHDLVLEQINQKQQALFAETGVKPDPKSVGPLAKIIYKRPNDDASLSLDVAMSTLAPDMTREHRQEDALEHSLVYRDVAGNVTAY